MRTEDFVSFPQSCLLSRRNDYVRMPCVGVLNSRELNHHFPVTVATRPLNRLNFIVHCNCQGIGQPVHSVSSHCCVPAGGNSGIEWKIFILWQHWVSFRIGQSVIVRGWTPVQGYRSGRRCSCSANIRRGATGRGTARRVSAWKTTQ